MSVVLYKDGESKLFEPDQFRRFLKAGWSLKKENDDALRNEETEESNESEKETTEAETGGEESPEEDVLKVSVDEDLSGLNDIKVTADINLDSLSNKEIRGIAKEACIDNWNTARIDSLKKALRDA